MKAQCESARLAVSARLDGEAAALTADEVEIHLEGCSACRHWRDAASAVTMRFRVQPVGEPESAPDAGRFAGSVRPHVLAWLLPAARVGLAVAGITQLVVTMHLLVTGDIDGFRDLGALDVAIGIGFLVAAARPIRAAGMRSIVGAAAVLLIGSALLDLVAHRTSLRDEVPHGIVLAGWLLLCVVARRTPQRRTAPSLTWRERFRRLGVAVDGSGPGRDHAGAWTWDSDGDQTVAEDGAVRRASAGPGHRPRSAEDATEDPDRAVGQ